MHLLFDSLMVLEMFWLNIELEFSSCFAGLRFSVLLVKWVLCVYSSLTGNGVESLVGFLMYLANSSYFFEDLLFYPFLSTG